MRSFGVVTKIVLIFVRFVFIYLSLQQGPLELPWKKKVTTLKEVKITSHLVNEPSEKVPNETIAK